MYLLKNYKMDAMTLIEGVEDLMGRKLGIADQDLEDIRFEDFTTV